VSAEAAQNNVFCFPYQFPLTIDMADDADDNGSLNETGATSSDSKAIERRKSGSVLLAAATSNSTDDDDAEANIEIIVDSDDDEDED